MFVYKSKTPSPALCQLNISQPALVLPMSLL